MTLYPWQNELWQQLVRMRTRMPHALLLQGRQGIGKGNFAEALAQYLLCEQSAEAQAACGTCQSCHWFLQQNHPDFRRIEPEEAATTAEDAAADTKPGKKRQISVDQIRDLADFFGLSSHREGLRVVLIQPAESLNLASANALLKMLEEPPPGFLFLMVTHQPQRLLPTIRSRCMRMDFPVPGTAVSEGWLSGQGIEHAAMRLAYVGGAPLQALDLDDSLQKRLQALHAMLGSAESMDPFAATALCIKEGLGNTVEALSKWIYDLLSAALAGEVRFHLQQVQALQALAKEVDLAKLLDYQRILDETRRHSLHPLNAELQLESLMIQYTQLFSTQPKS